MKQVKQAIASMKKYQKSLVERSGSTEFDEGFFHALNFLEKQLEFYKEPKHEEPVQDLHHADISRGSLAN